MKLTSNKVSLLQSRNLYTRHVQDFASPLYRRRYAISRFSMQAKERTTEDAASLQDSVGRSLLTATSDEWDVPDTYQRYQGEIFCNRALNMKRIKAVGFDMDYTLAQYIPETFELLGN